MPGGQVDGEPLCENVMSLQLCHAAADHRPCRAPGAAGWPLLLLRQRRWRRLRRLLLLLLRRWRSWRWRRQRLLLGRARLLLLLPVLLS